MKIAVTGATGFVGRHVVAEIERRSMSPILICRPSSRSLAALNKHKVVAFDLSEAPVRAFDLMNQPDTLIHLAWDGVQDCKSLSHFERELPMQYEFLKSLVESGLKNLVVTGTCFEYGMSSGMLSENSTAKPDTAYGLAKDTLRRQLEYLQQVRPFKLTWARLFYLYGDGQAASSLLPQLMRAVEEGEPVFDMSGGEQLRDYLSASDAARYLVSLAMTERDNGVVNVCSGSPVSVRRLVEGWIRENGWHISLNLGHLPYRDHEPMASWGDRDKLVRCLNAVNNHTT